MVVKAVALGAALAASAAACNGSGSRGEAPDGGAGGVVDAGARARSAGAPSPLTAVAVDAADRALRSLAAWRARPAEGAPGKTDGAAKGPSVDRLLAAHPAYLEMRRAAACGASFWQRRATVGGEVLLGPRRSANEAGGALLALDAALEAGDLEGAQREAASVERALRVIREEILRNEVPTSVASAALSNAAYDLGAMALESTSGLPSGGEAVLADLQGTLDAIEQGSEAMAREAPRPGSGAGTATTESALSAVRAEIAPLRARLNAARTSLDLADRASLVLATGRLGAATRGLGAAAGARPRLPYAPRVPALSSSPADIGEPVSALTLPARRAPRPGTAPASKELAALGRKLFTDVRLSRGDARSCASCHRPARAFADGLARPASLDPATPSLRHTPSLLYTSLHAAQLWDGHTVTPEDQALGVIHSRAEMGLSSDELVAKLGAVAEIRDAFAAQFPPGAGAPAGRASPGEGAGLTAENVGRALAAFEEQALAPADAPIDRFARGDEGALTADERAGLDVFAGAGRCARCHIPPFFGGSRPRDFAIPVFAVLGLPIDPKGRALDPDLGRARVTGRELDERAFKTPTVRDISRTAPYFHNGGWKTLDEVVDFYNRGGGKGLGLAVENQDPDVRPLKLTPEQIRVLLLFMRTALLDATPPERLLPEGSR